MSAVAKPYALALFQLAEKKGRVEAWEDELKQVRAALEQPDVLPFLKNPVVPTEAKRSFLQQAFGSLSPEVQHLLFLLADHRRLAEVIHVIDAYNDLAGKARGLLTGKVETALNLSKEEQAELAKRLQEAFGKPMSLTFEQNESLIGGIRVQIGDRVYDGSLAGQLNRLQRALHQG